MGGGLGMMMGLQIFTNYLLHSVSFISNVVIWQLVLVYLVSFKLTSLVAYKLLLIKETECIGGLKGISSRPSYNVIHLGSTSTKQDRYCLGTVKTFIFTT